MDKDELIESLIDAVANDIEDISVDIDSDDLSGGFDINFSNEVSYRCHGVSLYELYDDINGEVAVAVRSVMEDVELDSPANDTYETMWLKLKADLTSSIDATNSRACEWAEDITDNLKNGDPVIAGDVHFVGRIISGMNERMSILREMDAIERLTTTEKTEAL